MKEGLLPCDICIYTDRFYRWLHLREVLIYLREFNYTDVPILEIFGISYTEYRSRQGEI